MLVIGSHLGPAIGLVAQTIAPRYAPDPAALALIGTAAFFTASVRAPITGIVLATELTVDAPEHHGPRISAVIMVGSSGMLER